MRGLMGASAVVNMAGTLDGPFVELKEVVGGFMILSAESIGEAIEIARQCPGVLAPNASLEVREFVTS